MPTYDYRCTACGHTWELFQSMSAKHEKKCPKCGKAKAERLIGMGAAVVFKGGGFYQTDYRSEGYKQAAEADKKAGEPAAAESKTEAKPSDAKAVETKPSSEAKPVEAKPAEAKPSGDAAAKPAKTAAGKGKRKD